MFMLAASSAVSVQAVPAQAAQFLYTITGVTTDNMLGGIYGFTDPTLPVGVDFTVTYLVDDALPTAAYDSGVQQSYAKGGGLFVGGGSRPPVSAKLQIGASSYTVRQGDFFQNYIFDPVYGDASGQYIRELDLGNVTKNITSGTLNFDTQFSRNEVCCGMFSYDSTTFLDNLVFYLNSPEFTSLDFRETGTFVLGANSIGSFLTGSISESRNGPPFVTYDGVGLTATQLTVAAVPGPASWAIMIGGVGMIGGMMRGRRDRQLSRVRA
jgi:hypothetical protein